MMYKRLWLTNGKQVITDPPAALLDALLSEKEWANENIECEDSEVSYSSTSDNSIQADLIRVQDSKDKSIPCTKKTRRNGNVQLGNSVLPIKSKSSQLKEPKQRDRVDTTVGLNKSKCENTTTAVVDALSKEVDCSASNRGSFKNCQLMFLTDTVSSRRCKRRQFWLHRKKLRGSQQPRTESQIERLKTKAQLKKARRQNRTLKV